MNRLIYAVGLAVFALSRPAGAGSLGEAAELEHARVAPAAQ